MLQNHVKLITGQCFGKLKIIVTVWNYGDYARIRLKNQSMQIMSPFQSMQKDLSISPIIKTVIKNIFDYVHEQSLLMELMDKQLSKKASSVQVNYALASKISASEFAEHCGKVEKVLDLVELSKRGQQQLVAQSIEYQNSKIQKIDQGLSKLWKETEKLRRKQEDGKQLQTQILSIKKKLSGLQQNCKQVSKIASFEKEFKDLQGCCSQMKNNLDQLIQSLHEKLCIFDRHGKLLQNISFTETKYVRFDELRKILGQLQQNLNDSLKSYVSQINKNILDLKMTKNSISQEKYERKCQILDGTIEKKTLLGRTTPTFESNIAESQSYSIGQQKTNINFINIRWLGFMAGRYPGQKNQNLSASFMNEENCTNRGSDASNNLFQIGKRLVIIKEEGYYQIKCGFVPKFETQLKILCNDEVLATTILKETNKKSLCRVLMLYFRADQPESEIRIHCQKVEQSQTGSIQNKTNNISRNKRRQSQLEGFLSLEKLI